MAKVNKGDAKADIVRERTMATVLILANETAAAWLAERFASAGHAPVFVSQMLDVLGKLYDAMPDALVIGSDVEAGDALRLMSSLRRTAEWDHMPIVKLVDKLKVPEPIARRDYAVPTEWSGQALMQYLAIRAALESTC